MRQLVCLILLACTVFADVQGPLTPDFQSWLNKNGYAGDNFERMDHGNYGSYGGFTANAPKAVNTPVIFIHGNSDSALKSSSSATGWTNTVEYFLDKGFTSAEMYATSWGDTNALNAATRTHNCADLNRLRRFFQAVLAYTKAPKVSFITHSMGVTLGRKIIQGGSITAKDGNCNLGASMVANVDVFLGLAGANYGLCACEGTGVYEATCNKQNGLWPGDSCGLNTLTCGLSPLPWPCSSHTYSAFLMAMNSGPKDASGNVFSAWSYADNLILYGDEVWGHPTSLIPNSDGKKIYATYTHMETKELTADDQYSFVVLKKVPA